MSPPEAPINTEAKVENTGESIPFDITKVESISAFEGKSIPLDIISDILSRLPVKFVMRFQILSKLYKSAISDPWFSKINSIHLSKSDNLFLRLTEKGRFSLVRLEEGNFETEAELGTPFGPNVIHLCSCNGIVLILPMQKARDEIALWNPSIRKYTLIRTPVSVAAADFWLNYGLYYDSVTDDYKVVIITIKYHVVFSCKTRTWVEEEVIPCSESQLNNGVLVGGCFYWQNEPLDGEIWCFDLRERKTEKWKGPDDLGGDFILTTLWGRPCLRRSVDGKVRIWVRESCSWREVLRKPEVHLCLTRQHVLFESVNIYGCLRSMSRFMVFNDCEKGRMEISGVESIELVPCSESLFFPFEAKEDLNTKTSLLFPFQTKEDLKIKI